MRHAATVGRCDTGLGAEIRGGRARAPSNWRAVVDPAAPAVDLDERSEDARVARAREGHARARALEARASADKRGD